MDKDLKKYIKKKSAFDISDPLGKVRIRRLMYEYETLRWRYNKEINSYRQTTISQANAVTMMVEKLRSLEKENEYLKSYIRESDAAKTNLQANRMAADKQVHELSEENIKLKAELSVLRENYRELNDVHEAVMEVIHKERPDIEVDKIGGMN